MPVKMPAVITATQFARKYGLDPGTVTRHIRLHCTSLEPVCKIGTQILYEEAALYQCLRAVLEGIGRKHKHTLSGGLL